MSEEPLNIDKFNEWLLYAALFFLPISSAFLRIFLVLCVIGCITQRFLHYQAAQVKDATFKTPQTFSSPKSFLNKYIFIFLGITFLTIFFSQYPGTSFKAFFTKVLLSCSVYFLILEVINTRPKIIKTFYVLGCSSLLVVLNGLYQFVFKTDFLRGREVGLGISSSFNHPNGFGTYLIIVSTISLGLFLIAHNNKKYLLGNAVEKSVSFILFVLSYGALGLTFSRSAWFGFLIALVLIMVHYRKAGHPRKVISLIVLMSVFVIVFTPLLKNAQDTASISNAAYESQEEPDESNILKDYQKTLFDGYSANRAGSLTQPWMIIKKRPVFGSGLNTYLKALENETGEMGQYAKNSYLQMAAETGFLNFIAFIVFLGVFFLTVCVKQNYKSSIGYTLNLVLAFALFGLLVQSAFDTTLYSFQLRTLVWVILGLACAVFNIFGYSPTDKRIELPPRVGRVQKDPYGTFKIVIFTTISYVIVFALIIVGGELVFRVFKGTPNPLADITQQSDKTLFPPNSSQDRSSSIEGEFNYVSNINKFGYRGEDFNFKKDSGVLRVFAVGDSFTFGVGSEDYQTIPYLVEQGLKEKGLNVEVINAGIGHTSPITHYVNLKNIHLQYDPDVILLLFDFTDLWDDWHSERHAIIDRHGDIKRFDLTYKNGKRDWWEVTIRKSALAAYLHRKVVRTYKKIQVLGLKNYLATKFKGERAKAAIATAQSDGISGDEKIEYDGLVMLRGREEKALIDKHWKRTKKYLDKIKDLLDQRGIALALVAYPHGIYFEDEWNAGREAWGFEQDKAYDDYYGFELLEDYAQSRGILLINTLPGFLDHPSEDKFFFEFDGHLTPEGNERVVGQIVGSQDFLGLLNQAQTDQ